MVIDDLNAIAEKERAARKKTVIRCCMAAGCMSSGSDTVKKNLEQAVKEAGLENEVEVRGVGCMKLCCEGPLVQADPQNALYVKVTPGNAPSIVAALKGGKTVKRPWLGASLQNVSKDIADSLGLERPTGALVVSPTTIQVADACTGLLVQLDRTESQ